MVCNIAENRRNANHEAEKSSEKASASCMAATGFTEEEIRGREEKEIDRMLGFSSQEANTEYLTKIQEEKEIDRMCD